MKLIPLSGDHEPMSDAWSALSNRVLNQRQFHCAVMGVCLGAGLWLGAGVLAASPAVARGPEAIADVAEKVIDAVVNISTSQTVEVRGGGGDGPGAAPQLPPGLQDFFDDFDKNRRGRGGDNSKGGNAQPR